MEGYNKIIWFYQLKKERETLNISLVQKGNLTQDLWHTYHSSIEHFKTIQGRGDPYVSCIFYIISGESEFPYNQLGKQPFGKRDENV